MKETLVTLVSELQAKPGFKFIFEGPAKECYKCKLREVCAFKLEPNTVYKVVEVVGKKKHICQLRGGWVVVARVMESEVDALVDTRIAVEDAIITYRRKKCKSEICPHRQVCQSPYVRDGRKYRIVNVTKETLVCKEGELVKVTLTGVKE
ncbi:MAG: UPF0179 family protein [Candidatus Nezhaarchaeota archaeon]|nr:UPF0179 family protein [Candidatus Nezhaarchaeota archaeon]MCX8141645.1 UPF0179 family protein [Candidatus Nezhaarchaeota archaeon]MDW8049912.1 UPF0179 family protein [Nitrososphaerota archaeon]